VSTGKQIILARIRSALADKASDDSGSAGSVSVEAGVGRSSAGDGAGGGSAGNPHGSANHAPTPWEYGRPTPVANPLELFIERVIDYKATVGRAADESAVSALVARFLAVAAATSCAVPPGLEHAWLADAQAAGVELRYDDPPLSKEALDQTAAVLTTASVGMAETGTIALDHGPGQGRRILSLLPDTHICVIRASQIATDVPEALARQKAALQEGRPITWISGPSATSDIELSRVEGVHGPRNLYVIIVG
jgi:L-lactate dehydrogenase complex protein LldG